MGKALTARVFIAQINTCHNLANHPDLLWVEPTYQHQGELLSENEAKESGLQRKASPQIRIEQVREITAFLCRSPLVAARKVVVIEEAHQMASAAANALLKTLEEPTSGTIILLSSQPTKLLSTITSRCQMVPFHRLNDADMAVVLERLGRQDILNNPTLLKIAAGSPGAAIAYFNQLQSIPQSLLNTLATPPSDALTAIEIAKEIDTTLEFHSSLWLLDYLQHRWWYHFSNVSWVSKLEDAKAALLKMVSPRLVWEVLLIPDS